MLRFTSVALSNPNRPELPPLIVQAVVVQDDFRIAIGEDISTQLELTKIADQEAAELGEPSPTTLPLFGPLCVNFAGREAFSSAILCSTGVVVGAALAQQLGMDSYIATGEMPTFMQSNVIRKIGNANRILRVEKAVDAKTCKAICDHVMALDHFRLGVLDSRRSSDLPQRSFVDVSERDTFSAHLGEDMNERLKHVFLDMIVNHVEPFYGKRLHWWERPQLLCYKEGGRYDPHVDADRWVGYPNGGGYWEPYLDRHVSLLIYLNEEFTGGALNFPDHKMKIQPKTGTLVAFPSSSEFRHGAEPTKSGIRLVMVSWATLKDRELFNPDPQYEVYFRDDFKD